MTPVTNGIGDVGYWSGLAAFAATVAYVVVQLLQVAGLLRFPLDEVLIYGTSLCIVIPFMLAMLSLHYLTPNARQFWTHAALIFTIVYAVFVPVRVRRWEATMSMDYAAAVRDTWRHHELGAAARDYVQLVRYATLAASSHNTQPWKFALEPGRIVILPDLSRRCPAIDPDDHHLYASLGCAAENLVLAAQAAGLHSRVSYDASRSSVQVNLEETPAHRSALFEAIPSRQCSRTEYDGTALSGDQLRLLDEAGRGDGVSVMLLTDSRQKEQVAEYVAEGNRAQFGDPRWAAELRAWIRFNGCDAVRAGDGLYGRALGSPDVPGWMGRLFMRLAFSTERQNRKEIAYIRSSAAIAVFVSEADDTPHWTEAGRCYERLALQAAALELRSAFLNQPVEVTGLRQQFATFLGIGRRRPDLVIRIGRGPEMPRSLRRPVEQVLV